MICSLVTDIRYSMFGIIYTYVNNIHLIRPLYKSLLRYGLFDQLPICRKTLIIL